MRHTQRNFDRQIWALEALSALSRFDKGRYEIETFEVEEWAGNIVCVKRRKRPLKEDGTPMRIYYEECYKVGPRGKVTTIYSTLY